MYLVQLLRPVKTEGFAQVETSLVQPIAAHPTLNAGPGRICGGEVKAEGGATQVGPDVTRAEVSAIPLAEAVDEG